MGLCVSLPWTSRFSWGAGVAKNASYRGDLKNYNNFLVTEKIQYDYMQAYLYFYLEQPDKAEEIALEYTNYPVNKWQSKFKNILSQIREIRGVNTNSRVTENRQESQNT